MKQHARQNIFSISTFLLSLLLVTGCKKDVHEARSGTSGGSSNNNNTNNTNSCTDVKHVAGITVAYNTQYDMLEFKNADDFFTVTNQLASEYEEYNLANTNQTPGLSEADLDELDNRNQYDEFQPYKRFESMFPCFTSRRSQIEGVENQWLGSNMSGQDPDDMDLTFDDATNTLFNQNYEVMIRGMVYTLQPDGLHSSNGLLEIPSANCMAYQKMVNTFSDNGMIYKVKLAIVGSPVFSETIGKAVAYRKNELGQLVRARKKMNLTMSGNIYDDACNPINSNFSLSFPQSGSYTRRQLTTRMNSGAESWKTRAGELRVFLSTDTGNYDTSF